MNRDDITGDRCISADALGRLAIRLLSGAGGGPDSGGPAPSGLPEELFGPGEEDMARHIDECSLCRARLLAEIHQHSEYLKGLEEAEESCSAGEDDRKRRERADEGENLVELEFLPYEKRRHGGVLAADTAEGKHQPLRFASGDREYVIRKFFDTIENRWFVQLTGILPVPCEAIRVVVDGEEFPVDQRGHVQLDEDRIRLSPDSRIRLRFSS